MSLYFSTGKKVKSDYGLWESNLSTIVWDMVWEGRERIAKLITADSEEALSSVQLHNF